MKRFELAKKIGFLSLTVFGLFLIMVLPVRALDNEENSFYKKPHLLRHITQLSTIIEEDPNWKETFKKNDYSHHEEDTYTYDNDEEYTYTYDNDEEYTYIEDINMENNDIEDIGIEHRDLY